MSVSVPPKQPDPFESRYVTAGNSTFGSGAGDGLFLKVPVKAGDTVAFYNGIRSGHQLNHILFTFHNKGLV